MGRRLEIPLGATTKAVLITAKTDTIRFSIETADPVEAKIRQAEALAFVEAFFQAARSNKPAALDMRQATALSKEIYLAWAEGATRGITVQFEQTADSCEITRGELDPETEARAARIVFKKLKLLSESNLPEDRATLDGTISPLIDRVLGRHGIAEVDPQSRELLLTAFRLALQDGFAIRLKRMKFDFTPDPKAARYPDWEPPKPVEAAL